MHICPVSFLVWFSVPSAGCISFQAFLTSRQMIRKPSGQSNKYKMGKVSIITSPGMKTELGGTGGGLWKYRWHWSRQRRSCCVSVQGLQPLEGAAYAVCTGCVPHGAGKPEPSTVKWYVLAYRICPAASLSVPTLSFTLCPRKGKAEMHSGMWRATKDPSEGCIWRSLWIGTVLLCQMWHNVT